LLVKTNVVNISKYMKYTPTIGLEVHAELKTETKMFCDCKNDPLEKTPNINVCPICLAHPGVLPTINKRAVELMILIGNALGGEILSETHFDRKSYFYPDMPKGYQISQYDYPIVKGGDLNGVKLTRVHLEEDTGRLAHDKDGALVDFNRASLPLMELVTEPVIKTSEEVTSFAKELQLVLRYLGASDADMEKGQMRVEANVSISRDKKLGTKVELKNINSFKAVSKAIAYELKRQEEVLESGGEVIQETRGWNDKKNVTFSQRIKEEANDYRYMPEPDLPIMDLKNAEGIDLKEIKLSVPELPSEKRARFISEYKVPTEQLDVLINDMKLADYYEKAMSELASNTKDVKKAGKLLTNYLTSDVIGILNDKGISMEDLKMTPENFAELPVLIENGEITSRIAKDLLIHMIESGHDPHTIIDEKEMGQISDEDAIETAIKEVIEENKKAVEEYKNGKETVIKFMIGQAMAKLRGRGNPELLEKLFVEHLSDH